MTIRKLTVTDIEAVDELIFQAFLNSEHGYGNEVELVHRIRKSPEYKDDLEMVFVKSELLIGYGLLSEVHVVNGQQRYKGLVLAPLAVAVGEQGKGIGTALLESLESQAKKMNYPYISILGDPAYYGRFSYVPASQYAIQAPFEVLDQAFMIKALHPGSLDTVSGLLQYPKTFDDVAG